MERSTNIFVRPSDKKRYFILLVGFLLLSIFMSYGLLAFDNPVDPSSPSYEPIVRRRANAIIAMFIAAVCQSLSTISFQTVTNNRVITPSLLGFEALYTTIQTATIYFFGSSALINFTGLPAYLTQVFIMIVASVLLYGTLLNNKESSMDTMLLIGVVLGQGLSSISTFMRRVLSPSEFDILQARLFASVNHAESEYFPIVIPIVILAAILLLINSRKLNVLSLGRDVAENLGLSFRKNNTIVLIIVSILMSISTALVGPMTFYGFLVAILTYEIVPSYDHKYIFLMAMVLGFLILTGAYFIMEHVFNAQGVVSIIIELFGGIVFLMVILRRRDL